MKSKQAIRVGAELLQELGSAERYLLLAPFYGNGFTHADQGVEDLYLLTEPLPKGVELGDFNPHLEYEDEVEREVEHLEDLGYEVLEVDEDSNLTIL